jgi:hypothetical protein
MSRKRISQETFDEVVEENVNEFDMSKEEAIDDAIQQFKKQGIDLTNIDTTVDVEGRKSFLDHIRLINEAKSPICETELTSLKTSFQHVIDGSLRSSTLYRRNLSLLFHQGGLIAIYSHLNLNEDRSLLLLIIPFLTALSSSSIEIRDFFEPGGAEKMVAIIKKCLDMLFPDPSSRPLEFDEQWLLLLEISINFCRIVAKSERNKSKLLTISHFVVHCPIISFVSFFFLSSRV